MHKAHTLSLNTKRTQNTDSRNSKTKKNMNTHARARTTHMQKINMLRTFLFLCCIGIQRYEI